MIRKPPPVILFVDDIQSKHPLHDLLHELANDEILYTIQSLTDRNPSQRDTKVIQAYNEKNTQYYTYKRKSDPNNRVVL